MIRSLWTAATGMEAQQLNIDTISNNLANVNTTGFKKSRIDFQDLLYQTMRPAGATEASGTQVPTGIQVGMGTKVGATQKIFSQGEFQQSGNPLDLVIQGDGFFQVTMGNGETGYTRDGTFKRSKDGLMVTSDGSALDPQITIPSEATDINIASNGTVSIMMPGQSTPQQIGNIQVARFSNPAGLKSLGQNLFGVTDASGQATPDVPGQNGLGSIQQGFVEMSNVKVVEEMVNMIVAQRAYEINAKAIQTSDDMLQIANNLRR
jgi:flagellar basal-body rod protein FlgG